MENNKVVLSDGTTLIDITDTTAAPETVALGEVFYDAAGVRRVGTGDYMSKVTSPTADDILVTDSSGQAVDSGVSIDDLATETYVDDKFVVINWQTADYATIRELAESRVPFWVIDPTLPISDPTTKAFHATQVTVQPTFVSFKVLVAYTNYGYTVRASEKNRATGETYAANAYATDSAYGLVKTNSAESISLNSDGQLDIGGRLGQMATTNGIFHPKTAEPRKVQNYSFMVTDAKGMNVNAARVFGILTGYNMTLTASHPAGSTSYTVANTYNNRIFCSVLSNGGFIALSEADARDNRTVYVDSVTIDGQPFTPDSSANDSSKPITINVSTSVNPDSATKSIRLFGAITGGFCSEYIGQAVGGASGVSLIIGQGTFTKSGNMNAIVGQSIYNAGNGNSLFGRFHISTKNRWLMAGTGHDNTNGVAEAGAAVGAYSDIQSDTLFAVGNGTDHTARNNAFEVKSNGSIYAGGDKVALVDSGFVSSTSVAAGAYVDVTVDFNKTFASAPKVVAGLASTSTAADLGSISAAVYSVTTTGATIRIYNNSSGTRAPGLYWIATG